MIDEKRRHTGVSPRTSVGRTPQPPPTFEVAGEVFVSAGDAARVILEACDLSPSGAYQTVQRAARDGNVRTVQATPRVRWYHAADVAQLADRLRGA